MSEENKDTITDEDTNVKGPEEVSVQDDVQDGVQDENKKEEEKKETE